MSIPPGLVRGLAFIKIAFIKTLWVILGLAILGTLAVLFGPNSTVCTVHKTDVAKVHIRMIEASLDQHRLDTAKYPDSLEGLVKNTVSSPRWDGPYLKQGLPKDPWGNDYQYKKPGNESREYDLISFGSDGQPGGEGEAADITNWEVKNK